MVDGISRNHAIDEGPTFSPRLVEEPRGYAGLFGAKRNRLTEHGCRRLDGFGGEWAAQKLCPGDGVDGDRFSGCQPAADGRVFRGSRNERPDDEAGVEVDQDRRPLPG